jgi:hypothetical protein
VTAPGVTGTPVRIVLAETPVRRVVTTTDLPNTGAGRGSGSSVFTGLLGAVLIAGGLAAIAGVLRKSQR